VAREGNYMQNLVKWKPYVGSLAQISLCESLIKRILPQLGMVKVQVLIQYDSDFFLKYVLFKNILK